MFDVAKFMAENPLNLFLVQALQQTLVDRESCIVLRPAEGEGVGSWVGGYREPRHWDAGFSGKLADFCLEPLILTRLKIVKVACPGDYSGADEVLNEHD